AKADTIDALEKYRGRCEPTFLFFAGGILTSYIHGADAPKVQKVITEQLASEHKILEGTGERKEVKDPVITREQEKMIERLAEEEALRLAEEPVGYTVAFIKPDAVAANKVDDIIAEIKENNITVLAEQERDITQEEAMVIYSSLHDEPYYDDLIRFITSGPSHLMLLTVGESGVTSVKDWKELLGPSNVEQAKEEAPSSLRAKYGDKGFMNALHGSATKDAAVRERQLFFPNYQLPTYQKKKENIQWTLAIIRPEVYATKKDAIVQKIKDAGFKIIMLKEVQMTKDQAADFYKDHEHYAYFDSLVEIMSSGPFLVLTLSKDEAIKAWKNTIGPSNIDEAMEKAPQSLRAQFQGASGMNQVHGSDSEETAKDEIAYFFPMEQTVAVIKPHAMEFKDEILARINESGFKIAAQKETTIGPIEVEVLYTDKRDKAFYDELVNSMTSGPALFMVLSREGAVKGWRLEMGDVDPEVAKSTDPDSLRALYGTSLLLNAVHGSSSLERAKEEMQIIFGDLKFSEDGTVKGAQPDLDATALEPEVSGERNDRTQNEASDRKSQDGKDDDDDAQDEAAKNTQEHYGQEDDGETGRARDADDRTDNNSADHRQRGRKSQGSDHNSVNGEQEDQERGYHGDADDNINSEQRKVTEEEAEAEAADDIEQSEGAPEGGE
ncbi:unnamed protein product, partial [Candidula unifasciata]